MNGIHEADGSIPSSSTTGTSERLAATRRAVFICPLDRGKETLTVGIDPNILPPLNGP